MVKIRVHELAEELGISSGELSARAASVSLPSMIVRSPSRLDVPRLVVPSTDLVPRRHHEALKIAAPLLDPPPVLTEVVEHDLEHMHRRTGSRRRRTPTCPCLGDRADRVDHHRCSHLEAARDDGLSNEVSNRTEWGLQLAAPDDGGLHCVQAYDCCRHLSRQPTRQGRLPCSRQTCNDDEHAAL
jgi:hypothetical protein